MWSNTILYVKKVARWKTLHLIRKECFVSCPGPRVYINLSAKKRSSALGFCRNNICDASQLDRKKAPSKIGLKFNSILRFCSCPPPLQAKHTVTPQEKVLNTKKPSTTPTQGHKHQSGHSLNFSWNPGTTLKSMMNAKLSRHGFWPCRENGLIKKIQTIPHNLCVSFKSASPYWGLG